MKQFNELVTLLQSLRMNRMMETLETRNRQALDEKLAPIEFLTLLFQDEVARREQVKLQKRLRQASFHSLKTIESFNFQVTPNLNRTLMNELMTCRFIMEKAPVLIAGPTGTGKSHLAQAIGHQAVRQGYEVFFSTQVQLTASMVRARLSGVHARRMKLLKRKDLIILDDFGIKPLQSPYDEDLHELIAERYEKGAVMVTSNLAFKEWREAFTDNKLLGAATVDRMMHGAYQIVLDGESYRKPRPQEIEG
ncbi:MAG: IS21-like element helper ATPase IstB [Betaproteobacteria bacterium]|jgi:DNA replication protein DnaC